MFVSSFKLDSVVYADIVLTSQTSPWAAAVFRFTREIQPVSLSTNIISGIGQYMKLYSTRVVANRNTYQQRVILSVVLVDTLKSPLLGG